MSSVKNHINSDYFSAANTLRGKSGRRRIVAYVESYDDVLFWRMILSEFEDDTRYFEVMLPIRSNLSKGKKSAFLSLMRNGMGKDMIACVDADYDYLLQGANHDSAFMLDNPYVIHTFVYAIENYQCYAPSLHNVCVMATLNDTPTFDFVDFLSRYSRIIFPLFVWNIMMYRRREYGSFTITDFNTVARIQHKRTEQLNEVFNKLHHKVRVKINELQRHFPNMKEEYLRTKESLISLGVTQDTTYLFIQGHHLFDCVVLPTMQTICEELRRQRETEIRRKAKHVVQMQNELSAYMRSVSDISEMLKKNLGYTKSEPYQRVLQSIEKMLGGEVKSEE